MAQFYWTETPRHGTCVTCGTSASPAGFVDMFADVNVKRGESDIIGNIDIIMCANCLEQASREVGCSSMEETADRKRYIEKLEDGYEKAKDAAYSWQQRYENLVEILAMIKPNDGPTGSDPIVAGLDDSPSPDLRVQEGELVNSQSDGAVAKRRKNARG